MKRISFILLLALLLGVLLLGALLLGGCTEPVLAPAYRLSLPGLPAAWEDLAGNGLRWRLEWLSREGKLRIFEGPADALPELELPWEWSSPVLAYPFTADLPPGLLRPAGAIYPFDAEGARLNLSWEAGPEAVFYRELAQAAAGSASLRSPEYFDWPRFRTLLRESDIPEEVRGDLWLVDWQDLARRTVQGGFDRRQIKAAPRISILVTIPGPGPWAGRSPFTPVQGWAAGDRVELSASGELDLIISPGGMLKFTQTAQIWLPRTL